MKANNVVKSLAKSLVLLQSFSNDKLELGTTEIARKMGISKATSHRILKTFREFGILEKDINTGKYTIGLELYYLGNLYLRKQDFIRISYPVVKTLNELSDETILILIFDRGNVVIVYKEESRRDFRVTHTVGTIVPAYSAASGKAFLSELTEEEIDNLYPGQNLNPITRKTIKSKAVLKQQLEQIRKTGVSFARGECYEGTMGIASLLHDATGRAIAAISIMLQDFRINQDTINRLSTLVRMGANLISLRLGYNNANNLVRDVQDIRSWWEQEQTMVNYLR